MIMYSGEIPGINIALLKKLYEAKCADIQRQTSKEQERRFLEYCSKVIRDRKIELKEVIFGNF